MKGQSMKIQNINFNLFRSRNVNQTETKNPFAAANISNPFAGGLQVDIFQKSNLENKQPNIFAQKAAEIVTGWNKGVENLKNGAKEFFAPAVSFAGKIQAGYKRTFRESQREYAFYGGFTEKRTFWQVGQA